MRSTEDDIKTTTTDVTRNSSHVGLLVRSKDSAETLERNVLIQVGTLRRRVSALSLLLTSGTSATQVLDPLLYSNTDRFRVLRDTRYLLQPGFTTADAVTNVVSLDEYIPLKGMETVFSTTSADPDVSIISSGALYVIFRVTGGAGSTVSVNPLSMCRLRYDD